MLKNSHCFWKITESLQSWWYHSCASLLFLAWSDVAFKYHLLAESFDRFDLLWLRTISSPHFSHWESWSSHSSRSLNWCEQTCLKVQDDLRKWARRLSQSQSPLYPVDFHYWESDLEKFTHGCVGVSRERRVIYLWKWKFFLRCKRWIDIHFWDQMGSSCWPPSSFIMRRTIWLSSLQYAFYRPLGLRKRTSRDCTSFLRTKPAINVRSAAFDLKIPIHHI